MRNLIILLISLCSFTIYAQEDYVVTTLDSIVTTTVQQGVYGLSAIVKDNNVHLAYFHGTAEEQYFLVYEIRKSGQQISKEIVHEYSDPPRANARTVIQFDESGNPYIYCTQIVDYQAYISVASNTGEGWQINIIDNYRHRDWLHTSGDGYQELGFVTEKQGDNTNNWQPVINYFSFEDGTWINHTLSTSSYQKSRPICFHYNDVVYIAFAEQHTDTVKVFMHKKENNIWSLELELTFPQSAPANNHWCRLGVSEGNIHFLHTYDMSEYSQPLTHLINSGSGWEEVPIEINREDYLFETVRGNNIDVANNGNLYFVTRDITWVLEDNKYSEYSNPLTGTYYGYYDMAIIDDEIYLYAVAGDKNYPHGDPVMFYEAIGSISTINNVQELDKHTIENYWLSPNPGQGSYILELEVDHTADVYLQWVDLLGRNISGITTYNMLKGKNRLEIHNPIRNTGNYFIRVTTGKRTLLIPLIQL